MSKASDEIIEIVQNNLHLKDSEIIEMIEAKAKEHDFVVLKGMVTVLIDHAREINEVQNATTNS